MGGTKIVVDVSDSYSSNDDIYADDFIEDMVFCGPQAVIWAGSSMSRRNNEEQ